MSSQKMKRKALYSGPGNADPLLHPGHGDALSKRQRLAKPACDFTQGVSDELLLRIFSYADEQMLLNLAPVSRRFYRISSDAQLWRQHYYRRFILPRASRIPGLIAADKFYDRLLSGMLVAAGLEQSQGHASASVGAKSEPGSSIINRSNNNNITRALPPLSASWAEVAEAAEAAESAGFDIESIKPPFDPTDLSGKTRKTSDVDWKQQYRLRNNWARGSCEVRQVEVSPSNFSLTPIEERRTLVKVVDGLAVTVDMQAGLRAWDLRTQQSIAQTTTETDDGIRLVPTALALDGARLSADVLDIMVGFNDGTFGIWRLIISKGRLSVLYRQEKSYVGRLISVAYSYPYAMTAAELGFISLFTFERPKPDPVAIWASFAAGAGASSVPVEEAAKHHGGNEDSDDANDQEPSMVQLHGEVARSSNLSGPHLLSLLKSDYSRQPLVLSIRKLKSSAVASIAYSFDTEGSWALGIQNIDIRPSGSSKPDVITSRVAYTDPANAGHRVAAEPEEDCPAWLNSPGWHIDVDEDGPAKLCYSHPYLLATMHDNTLVLFVVTATEKSFAISTGMKLFGHTSGIADADITPAGTAVSVSERGDEIRVWDLEKHVESTSVEVRPRVKRGSEDAADASSAEDGEHWRNWVGTDNHRVTVLRQSSDGRESLVTYDFT